MSRAESGKPTGVVSAFDIHGWTGAPRAREKEAVRAYGDAKGEVR